MELIRALILPSNFAVLLGTAALVLLLLRRGRRTSLALLATAIGVVLVFSSGLVASLLTAPLEYRYPFLADPTAYPDAKRIVVLTGYGSKDPLMPASSHLNSSAAYRVLEARHIWLSCRSCEIYVSGDPDAAQVMRDLLVELGVPAGQIQVDGESPHTDVSARNLRPVLEGQPFFLVTSAGYMPRAMAVFRKQGLRAIPAPTDYLLPKNPFAAGIAPQPLNLQFSSLAINEYAGLLWYYLNGRI